MPFDVRFEKYINISRNSLAAILACRYFKEVEGTFKHKVKTYGEGGLEGAFIQLKAL